MQEEQIGRDQYGGQSREARLSERRQRLLEAGLELFGTTGFQGAPVKAICAEAGLTERYFYESFADREDLLFAVYESILDEVGSASVAAALAAEPTISGRARAGLSEFFGLLTSDERKARVLVIEVVGVSERLEARRRQAMRQFGDFITEVGTDLVGSDVKPAIDTRLAGLALAGGANELLVEWIYSEKREDPAALAEVCADLLTSAGRSAFGDID